MSKSLFEIDITRIQRTVVPFMVEAEDSHKAQTKALDLAANYDLNQASTPDVEYEADLVSAPGDKTSTREQLYLAQGGNNCPKCGETKFECGNVQTDGMEAWRSVLCNGCGASWNDVYTMTGIDETDGFDPAEMVASLQK